jgi:hypothetical protein
MTYADLSNAEEEDALLPKTSATALTANRASRQKVLYSTVLLSLLIGIFTSSVAIETPQWFNIFNAHAHADQDLMLASSQLEMPALPADRPLRPATDLDAAYCPNSSCKFFFPVYIAEQESKAQEHLYHAALMAHALGRILVLPHVNGSRMNACAPNPFSFYYEVESLQRLGFKTILQDGRSLLVDVWMSEANAIQTTDLFKWINNRSPTPTGQTIELSISQTQRAGSFETAKGVTDPLRFPGRRREPNRFCIDQPQSYLDFEQWNPITFWVGLLQLKTRNLR